MQLRKAAKFLDSGAVSATRILWRHPRARVGLLFYLVRDLNLDKSRVHLWCCNFMSFLMAVYISSGFRASVLDVSVASPPGMVNREGLIPT